MVFCKHVLPMFRKKQRNVLIAGIAYAVAGRSDMQKPLQAMYIPAGKDGNLMIGEGTGNVFTVTMPENIQDKNGKKSLRKI